MRLDIRTVVEGIAARMTPAEAAARYQAALRTGDSHAIMRAAAIAHANRRLYGGASSQEPPR